MCKTCHIDQPKLSKEEIDEIRKRAKLNKNPRPKRCTKECAHCQKIIERKNYKIYQNKNTSQIQENQIPNIINHINNSESRQNKNQSTSIEPNTLRIPY